MDHFDIRSDERVGHRLDKGELRREIEAGAFRLLSACGQREEYAVPIDRAAYRVVYDRRWRQLVTIMRLETPASFFKKKLKRGKRRQTSAKKLVPMMSYGRMAYGKKEI